MLHYSFTGFLLASAIVLAVCWIIYRLVLESKARPEVNRMAILSIYALMIVVPLVVAAIPVAVNASKGIEPQPQLLIMEIEGAGTKVPDAPTLDFADVLSYIYFAGMATTSLITIAGIVRLLMLRSKAERMEINGVRVYAHSDASLSSFSWLNNVFLFNQSVDAAIDERDMLLVHELAHIKKLHWIDLLVARLVIVFQWFNPAAWLLSRELQKVHEFQADACVLSSGVREEDYQMVLINNISRSRFTGLTDGLNNCSLKQRIIMMQKKTIRSGTALRCLAVVAVAAGAGVLLHQPAMAALMGTVQPIAENSEVPVTHENYTVKTDNYQVLTLHTTKKDTGTKAEDYTYRVDGRTMTYEEVQALDPMSIKSVEVNNGDKPSVDIKLKSTGKDVKTAKGNTTDELTVVAYVNDTTTADKTESNAKHTSNASGNVPEIREIDDAYTAAEVMPEYNGGGMSGLMHDLALTIRYPESEMKSDVSAQVVIQFIVDSKGKATNFKVVKSQGEAFDEAAMKAIKNLPSDWTPGMIDGKPVNVWFTIPIHFRTKGK